MRARGITLIELLVVLALIGMLTAGVAQAYVMGIDYEARLRASREDGSRLRRFEDRLADVLRQAYLSQDPADQTTYFHGGGPDGEPTGGPATTITFTAAGGRIPSVLLSTEDDFETLNDRYGPQGGVAEISLSTTPVGSAPNVEGLFLREQRPADGDYQQGGFERLFSDAVQNVEFEFFDGIQWQTHWDTTTQQKRLPAAIRVTYTFEGESEPRSFVVKLPMSDVTPQNPIVTEGSA